jgi:hypothetical protein
MLASTGASGAATTLGLNARSDGSVRNIGGFHPYQDPTLGAAIDVFGTPDSKRSLDGGNACIVRWRDVGLKVTFANFGSADACTWKGGLAQVADIRGDNTERWRTNEGLRIGDSEARLRDRYPNAARHGSYWWLVTATTYIGCEDGCPYGVLRAKVVEGDVRAFMVWIGAAGD